MENEFLKTKKDIITWLDKYEVKNYTLVEDLDYSYVVNVNGSINLSGRDLSFIPVKFNEVASTFSCDQNKLTTLEFSPQTVGGNFFYYENLLTSLKFCPLNVTGHFSCMNNQLSSLEYCPQEVGGSFYCHDNPELGDIQLINKFAKILEINKEIVRINKEKEQIDKELGKVANIDNLVKKSVLKV